MATRQVVCPSCGKAFELTHEHLRRARMAWSEKRQHYVRVMLTGPEWAQYQRKGSVD